MGYKAINLGDLYTVLSEGKMEFMFDLTVEDAYEECCAECIPDDKDILAGVEISKAIPLEDVIADMLDKNDAEIVLEKLIDIGVPEKFAETLITENGGTLVAGPKEVSKNGVVDALKGDKNRVADLLK